MPRITRRTIELQAVDRVALAAGEWRVVANEVVSDRLRRRDRGNEQVAPPRRAHARFDARFHLYGDVASTAIIVVVIRASTRVRVASKTDPSHTVSVRPACTTWPTTISRSVLAGFRK